MVSWGRPAPFCTLLGGSALGEAAAGLNCVCWGRRDARRATKALFPVLSERSASLLGQEGLEVIDLALGADEQRHALVHLRKYAA